MTTNALEARSGGVRIAYESQGEGEPVLFVHGLGYNRFGWGPAPSLLADGYRVLTFDNRGVGESDSPAGPYTVPGMAADAIAVLDAAGIDRAHVVGASLGGMIAQELALGYPDRLDRLVLACTHPGGKGSYPLPEKTLLLFGTYPQLPREEGLRLMVENALSAEAVRTRPELVDEIFEYRLGHAPPLESWQAQAGAAFTHDALESLARIEAPTLVVTGTADNVVDPRNSELIAARIRNARLERFEGGGHLFMWEQPQRFVDLVRPFLEEGR